MRMLVKLAQPYSNKVKPNMPANDRLLVLLRHGQSEWNLKNLFTGWRDVDLSPAGVEEAKAAGRRLKAQGITFDLAFTSALIQPSTHSLSRSPKWGRRACPKAGTRR